MEFMSKSEKQTFDFACEIAKNLKGGEVLLLKGDLGAGKTAFTKGLAKALGCDDVITSPTFTILNEHYGKILNLYHFDMYRIDDESELKELGFDEFICKKDGVCAIEWFEKTPSILPSDAILVDITKIDDEIRLFEISNLEQKLK